MKWIPLLVLATVTAPVATGSMLFAARRGSRLPPACGSRWMPGIGNAFARNSVPVMCLTVSLSESIRQGETIQS